MSKKLNKFGEFLNEGKSTSYDDMSKLILEYIKQTLNSKKQINQFVPNSHIAESFRDVLIYLELENMYPDEFHKEHKVTSEQWTKEKGTEYTTYTAKSDYHILQWLETDDYFNREKLSENPEDEIHRVYQKLRDKNDFVRNTMKIVNLHLEYCVMKHLAKKDLKAHKVRILR